jgi:DNA-binding Lrp family transcriptional regulator
MIDLDDIDRAILRALVRDATQTAVAISGRIGLSQPATWRRIKRLRDAGILAGQRLSLDAAKLGFGVTVFLGIKLATKGRVSLDDFERAVTAIPEVQLVEHVLGLYDYRLRVVARDLADFELVLRRRVMTLPGVGDVEANVLLSEERRPGPL